MSIRIGLYDFFAYTIPGIFYLIIFGFWIKSFGLVEIDLNKLNKLSVVFLLVIVGAGYIVGILTDFFAYRLLRIIFYRNSEAVKIAFDDFQRRHPWLVINFKYTEWGILFSAIKSKSLEAAMDIERNNVTAVMLRNIGLALILNSGSCLIYFLFVSTNLWNLVLSIIFLILAFIAMWRSRTRRHWFYVGIFEGFSAFYLPEKYWFVEKPIIADNNDPINNSK